MKAIGGRRRQIAGIYLRTALLLGALGSTRRGRARARARERARQLLRLDVLRDQRGLRRRHPDPARESAARSPRASARRAAGDPPGCSRPRARGARDVRIDHRRQRRASTTSCGALSALPRTAQIGVRSVGRRKRRSLATVLPDRVRRGHAARRARARHVGLEPDARGLVGSRLAGLARLQPAAATRRARRRADPLDARRRRCRADHRQRRRRRRRARIHLGDRRRRRRSATGSATAAGTGRPTSAPEPASRSSSARSLARPGRRSATGSASTPPPGPTHFHGRSGSPRNVQENGTVVFVPLTTARKLLRSPDEGQRRTGSSRAPEITRRSTG